MKNRAYCLGGSQDGVKVQASSNHFFSPNNELYSMCFLPVKSISGFSVQHPFWKVESMSLSDAILLANQYRPH